MEKNTAALNSSHKTVNQMPYVRPGLPPRRNGQKLALQGKTDALWYGSAEELNLFGDAQLQEEPSLTKQGAKDALISSLLQTR